MAKCNGCEAEIPDIDIEFGGGYTKHVYIIDGDIFCSEECLNRWRKRIGEMCQTESKFLSWMNETSSGRP